MNRGTRSFNLKKVNHFKLGGLMLIIPVTIAIAAYLFYIGAVFVALSMLCIIYCTSIIPALIIHVQYYIKNRGVSLIINKREKWFRYQGGKVKDISYDFSEIEKVVFYTPYRLKNGGGLLHFAYLGYYYSEIITKDGNVFLITCLLSPNVDDLHYSFTNISYKDVKVENTFRWYPIVFNGKK